MHRNVNLEFEDKCFLRELRFIEGIPRSRLRPSRAQTFKFPAAASGRQPAERSGHYLHTQGKA